MKLHFKQMDGVKNPVKCPHLQYSYAGLSRAGQLKPAFQGIFLIRARELHSLDGPLDYK